MMPVTKCPKTGQICGNCWGACKVVLSDINIVGGVTVPVQTAQAKTRENAAKVLLEQGWELEEIMQVLKESQRPWIVGTEKSYVEHGVTIQPLGTQIEFHNCTENLGVSCYCEAGRCKLIEQRERNPLEG